MKRWQNGLTPRARRWLAAGGAALALGVAGTWVLAANGGARAPGPTQRAGDTARGGKPTAVGMAGMNMAPSEGGEAHGAGVVRLTASQIRQFGVTFGTAEVRRLDTRVRTVGTVTVDETKLREVTARVGGYVERLYVNATGERVRRGQPLMDIYSPELYAAQQELLVARNLERQMGTSAIPGVPPGSPGLVAAARPRFALWDISDAQIDAILRSGVPRRVLTLYAPSAGVVLDRRVVQGQAIEPGAPLYTIADLSHVWIQAQIREMDAGAVRPGSLATARLVAYPGRPYDARVAFVYPTLDSTARTVEARLVVPNPDGLLKPGMYTTVDFVTPDRRALTVPTDAVMNTGTRSIVFVQLADGAIVPREVIAGRVAGHLTEILSGLRAGERVVTSAQFLLDSESNLAEVMRSMLAQAAPAGADTGMSMPMPASRPGAGPGEGVGAAAGAEHSGMPADKGADVARVLRSGAAASTGHSGGGR